MNTQDFIQALQSMGLLSPDDNAALNEFRDVVSILDLSGSLSSLGPDGGIPTHVIDLIYHELGGTGSFSVRSQNAPTEPVNQPRTIAAAAEPSEPGAIAPVVVDASIVPQEALDQIEDIATKVEQAIFDAAAARLGKIDPAAIALKAIDRRWGNAQGGKA